MKRVLDACCGSRMFYFDKADPEVLFADNRELETTLCDGRTLLVKPDIHMDFRNMPYPDNTFKVVVLILRISCMPGQNHGLHKNTGFSPKNGKRTSKPDFWNA